MYKDVREIRFWYRECVFCVKRGVVEVFVVIAAAPSANDQFAFAAVVGFVLVYIWRTSTCKYIHVSREAGVPPISPPPPWDQSTGAWLQGNAATNPGTPKYAKRIL